MKYSEFEKFLADELVELGVLAQQEFKVPANDRKHTLDLYIKSPKRAFIEIVYLQPSMHHQHHDVLKRRVVMFSKVLQLFKGAISPFLITFGELSQNNKKIFNGLNVKFLQPESQAANGKDTITKEYATYCAQKIRNTLVHSEVQEESGIDLKYLSEPLSNTGAFEDILVSFRPLMEKDQFDVMLNEIMEFNSEYESAHYSSAALCIGRTLEFVVYTLAQSWNIKVDKLTVKIIEDLKNSFDQVSAHLINYVHSEEPDKKDKRKMVFKKCEEHSRKVIGLLSQLDEKHDLTNTDVPINIQSILRDVKSQYSRIQEVREELDELINGKLLTSLMKLRNKAAHADTSGIPKKFNKIEMDGMAADLRRVLFQLSNISSVIKNNE